MKIFNKTQNNNTFYSPSESLNDLANKYETDKGTADKTTLSWGKEYPLHFCMNYTETYTRYMKPYRTVPINFLEIGICDKRFPYASPKMWMSYFKNVDLYCVDNFWGCVDINEKVDDIKNLNESGINFIYADQGNFSDWNQIKELNLNKFDYIVEDGSHWPNHMMVTLWQSCDLMKSGGYYFMEDIQNPLKSRGWYKYDNSLITDELFRTTITKTLNSSFLNDVMNKKVNDSYELVELVLSKSEIHYLAVFKRK